MNSARHWCWWWWWWWCWWRWRYAVGVLVVALTLALACSGWEEEVPIWRELVEGSGRCLVRNNYFVMEATRPLTDCQRLCGGSVDDDGHSGDSDTGGGGGGGVVKTGDGGGGVVKTGDGGGKDGGVVKSFGANVTREEFEPWAYLSRPIVVRGGALHWPALHIFSESFFRSLYDGVPGSYSDVAHDCQFLPFRTYYLNLQEALARQTRPKHWYFGWSNCSPGVGGVLREVAPRPSFLPRHTEHSALDWIFMGTHGPGAASHLDYVQRPSWQAQIRGTKTWHLRPVPECQHACPHHLTITVHRGDIVLVDTNQWYHTTVIHPGDISITIGSEYD
ncbi:hypothetical protein Pcinc_011151 [Petrolisthes cinctipes]|uniref:Uncharacterized protein n=1 Tax=Petrolisthes cinctipes TaxID=88211 RepID=A0AAE1G1V7_PETCI|nr:hypothetical protein Pcinc_011151 [Petrolisthes cinctipes]